MPNQTEPVPLNNLARQPSGNDPDDQNDEQPLVRQMHALPLAGRSDSGKPQLGAAHGAGMVDLSASALSEASAVTDSGRVDSVPAHRSTLRLRRGRFGWRGRRIATTRCAQSIRLSFDNIAQPGAAAIGLQ
jgi:hypothetical protein